MKRLTYYALQILRYAESIDLHFAKEAGNWRAAAVHRLAISRIDSKIDALGLQ